MQCGKRTYTHLLTPEANVHSVDSTTVQFPGRVLVRPSFSTPPTEGCTLRLDVNGVVFQSKYESMS